MNNVYQGSYINSRLELFLKSVLAQRFGTDSLEVKDDKFVVKIKNKSIDFPKSEISIEEKKNYLTLGRSFKSTDTIQITHQNHELPSPLFFVSRSNDLVNDLKQHAMIMK